MQTVMIGSATKHSVTAARDLFWRREGSEGRVALLFRKDLAERVKTEGNYVWHDKDGMSILHLLVCSVFWHNATFGQTSVAVASIEVRSSLQMDALTNLLDSVVSVVTEHRVRVVAGYFGGLGLALLAGLRARGLQINVLAWTPRLTQDGAALVAQPGMVLAIGPVDHRKLALEGSSGPPRWRSVDDALHGDVLFHSLWPALWPPESVLWHPNQPKSQRATGWPLLPGCVEKSANVNHQGVTKLLFFLGDKGRHTPEARTVRNQKNKERKRKALRGDGSGDGREQADAEEEAW